MKKIVCPIDLSQTANNALEYAAELCRLLKGELYILNTLFTEQGKARTAEENSLLIQELKMICLVTEKTFNIRCHYDIKEYENNLASTITTYAEKADLLVMGTNGMDEIYEFFFGTHTYNVIKKVKCPVLMVPPRFSFKHTGKTVIAWDYADSKNKISDFLYEFRSAFRFPLTFLHVSTHDNQASKDIFRISAEMTREKIGKNMKITFERISSDDPIFAIDYYMQENKADLLVLIHYDRGLLGSLFHGQVVRNLSNKASYPILVFRSH